MGYSGFEYAAMLAIAVAGSFVLRYFLAIATRRKAKVSEHEAWETFVASIRLRVPPNAELVVLEHQMYFNDPRNRAAAIEVFAKNSFETSTTESHEERTKYWLLAKRSTLIDRAPDELRTVHAFVQSYGGRYNDCNPQL